MRAPRAWRCAAGQNSRCSRILEWNAVKTERIAAPIRRKIGRKCRAENADADEAGSDRRARRRIFGQGGDYRSWSANVVARSMGTARASGLTKCRKAQVPGGKAWGRPASQSKRASRCAATKARLRVGRSRTGFVMRAHCAWRCAARHGPPKLTWLADLAAERGQNGANCRVDSTQNRPKVQGRKC